MTNRTAAILYIDDDEGLRRLTRRALERAGFQVDLAEGGEQGVAMATARAYDLVAVDHYMPGQDGLSTLAALQALAVPPPVIFVTGSDESRLAVSALKAGAIDYVVKTADADYFDLLARTIGQTLATARLAREKEAAETQLRDSNARLQALLQEVNHRVANSLQMVSSFVHMQSRALEDAAAKSALEDTQRRIAAIAQVHRRLYTSAEVGLVDMPEYLQALVDELAENSSSDADRRRITLVADRIALPADKAVAIGVVLNELVTNASKYAYPDGAGEVRVRFSELDPERCELVVEDDGCGLTDAGPSGTGLGSKLIGAMARTLRGGFDYDRAHRGTRGVLIAAR